MNRTADSQRPGEAPWIPVPSRAVSVVEHPCIIKNVDKGIVSLGGAIKLSKALRAKPKDPTEDDDPDDGSLKFDRLITASLRPDDPLAKRLLGTPVATANVLLKVTVPKRTGRKRKKGSLGPFVADRDGEANPAPSKSPYVKADTIFQCIRDNPTKYTATPVGVIDESHRFRTLPDLQVASFRNKTMDEIKDNLMDLRWSKLQNYNLDTTPGAKLTENIPVNPEFLQVTPYFNYKFKQNMFVKYTGDDRVEINVQKRNTVEGYHFIDPQDESVPLGPKPTMPPEHTLSPYVRSIIAAIKEELEYRPIITRHILYNKIGWDKRDIIREAAVYCGYFFTSGPWREALIEWGLDPRKDPFYRRYQTVSFTTFLKTGQSRSMQAWDRHVRDLAQLSREELQTQHIFDGVTASRTGNIFHFCDITDPLLRKILDTEDLRTTCAPTFQGWYHVGTWAKATVILKDKINRVIGGEKPDDSRYERILSWPDTWDDAEIYATYKDEMYDKEIHAEKAEEHRLMNMVRTAVRNPRYAFEKMQTVPGAVQESGGGDDQDAAAEVEVPEDLTEVPDGAEVIMDEAGSDDDDSGLEDDYDEEQDSNDGDDDGEAIEIDAASGNDDLAQDSDEEERPFGGLYPHIGR